MKTTTILIISFLLFLNSLASVGVVTNRHLSGMFAGDNTCKGGEIIDKSTYEEPAKYSAGVMYVLVNGVLVVNNGQLQAGIAPGRAVRASIKKER